MTSEFIFPFDQLNLAFFSAERIEKSVQKRGLIEIKAVKDFEYGKNNDGY